MAKLNDIFETISEDYIKDKLNQKERGKLLAGILWAMQLDVFNTNNFDGDCMAEDVRLSIIEIEKYDVSQREKDIKEMRTRLINDSIKEDEKKQR